MIPKRLEIAVDKLAKAFLNEELNAYDCSACAVGNICDGDRNWNAFIVLGVYHPNGRINDLCVLNKGLKTIKNSNYLPEELATIERTFLDAISDYRKKNSISNEYKIYKLDKNFREEANYAGLVAVIDLLFSFEEEVNFTVEDKQKQINKLEYG